MKLPGTHRNQPEVLILTLGVLGVAWTLTAGELGLTTALGPAAGPPTRGLDEAPPLKVETDLFAGFLAVFSR